MINKQYTFGIQLLCFVAITLTLALPAFARSDSKKVPPPNKAEKSMISLLKIEYDMAESQFLIHRTKKNQNRIELLLEKLVSFHCMRDLRFTFVYEKPPADNEMCSKFLTQLEEISEKKSPVALCARHGIYSQECVNAYDNQFIVTGGYEREGGGLENKELTQQLYRVRTEKQLSELSSALETDATAYKQNPNLENLENLERTMKELLQTSCKLTSIDKVDRKFEETDKANYNPSTTLAEDPVGQLVDQYQRDLLKRKEPDARDWRSSPTERKVNARNRRNQMAAQDELNRDDPFAKKTESDTKDLPLEDDDTEYYRARFVSDECQESVDAINKINERFAYTPCYREGFLSPRCVSRLKVYREKLVRRKEKKALTSGGNTRTPRPGLATF